MDEPSVLDRISSGLDFLLRHRNPDGGVPAVGLHDGSGCWTTSAALEALASLPVVRPDLRSVNQLVDFLCDSQMASPKRLAGSWPLMAGGRQGSTLATAHAIIALSRASAFPGVTRDLSDAIDSARAWLLAVQSEDGGWGVEPIAGSAGSASRMVSTFVALRALGVGGATAHSLRAAERGAAWVLQAHAGDGAFRSAAHSTPDPCSSARAIMALHAVDALKGQETLVSEVTSYLLATKPVGRLWLLYKESYVPDGAAGQVFFNQNSTAEILECLSQLNALPSEQSALVRWFRFHQNDDGSWHLGANDSTDPDTLMWPTADALLALKCFLRGSRCSFPVGQTTEAHRPWRRTALWALSLAGFELLLIVGLPSLVIDTLRSSWNALPAEFKASSAWAFGLGVLASVVAASIYSGVARLLKKRRAMQ